MRTLESRNKLGRYPAGVTAGRAKSPILRPDENHCLAKDWSLRAPDGAVYRFRNLSLFVRTHRDLFTPEELVPVSASRPAATFFLGMLRPGRANRRNSWHGWTWAE